MNTINYNVYDEVIESILNKTKTMEIRLYNDKSKNIKIGDIIRFKSIDNDNNQVLVRVTDLILYNNVDDLIEKYDSKISTNNINKTNIKEVLFNIFGEDNVISTKIIGICFELI